MQTATSLTRQFRRPAAARLFARALAWLIAADSAYRQRQQLRRLDDAALRDLGLTRKQARTGTR
ncbi:DUF1127 domain-containing protein [Marinovum sp.]|uniref:DUF1127 domain-containing protein n=1 Tax=Marinovum sp. TaxID=2024839 RepID=UPI002B269BEB|nr:DUF1127 domain-containing protein [Marinovum sp.]